MARVAEEESLFKGPQRGLELLAGATECDPELVDLGFKDALIENCRLRRICPRIDGSLSMATKTKYSAASVWQRLASVEVFPEMLMPIRHPRVESLIDALCLEWYEDEELSDRLEHWVSQLEPAEAGAVVGELIAAEAVPDGAPELLFSADGKILPRGCTAFLMAGKPTVRLPRWFRQFGFLHENFSDSFRRATGDPPCAI